MSNKLKWLIVTLCIIAAVLLVTFGFKLMFDFVLGPLSTIVLVFIIYGIGRVWTRSPSAADSESDDQ